MTVITRRVFSIFLTAVSLCSLAASQSANSSQSLQPSQASAIVPRLVNYSGKALDANGKVVTGTAGATFAIYSEQSGGAPLWMETQNIQADSKSNYTAQLGATKPEGLPLDLFTSGEARWLGVSINGGEEQPRVLLLSVPYALKAADAQTLGGLPASAFVLASTAVAGEATRGEVISSSVDAVSNTATAQASQKTASDVTTSGGAVNALPLFTTATNIQNSILTQSGTTAINVAGKLNHPATGTATGTAGKNSQPETFVASTFNKTTNAAVAQTFLLQAEPTGNDTTSTGATLNLLYGSGTSAPAETGLKIGQRGVIGFASGQTFPIPNAGITDAMLAHSSLTVNAGTGLTGGGTVSLGGTTTLNVNTAQVPLLAAPNVFTNNQAISAGPSTWGLTVSQPGYQTILEQGPASGVGTALEMQTTGSGGMAWQILNTGAASSQGSNKLNFRNDSAGADVMTLTATGQVGIGTNSPTATLDVQGNLNIQGNAVQPVAGAGFVKAMMSVNALNPPYQILNCYNSTLTGAAATTPPCGINFTEDVNGIGFWDLDPGFEVDNRFFSATLFGAALCIGAYPISPHTVQVTTAQCGGSLQGAYFYLLIY
jgi:hypothetical protein